MQSIVLIGDAHGMMGQLSRIQQEKVGPKEMSIQLGDMGCGFTYIPRADNRHKFIRGNHDDPAVARAHPNYLGDYGILKCDAPSVIFFISGADSIDKDMRIIGHSWWADEELSITELGEAIDLYRVTKPDIVISHECPAMANKVLLQELMGNYFFAKQELRNSRTCVALQAMLDAHQPKLWIFGHYHISKAFKVGNTQFQCLGELECYRLNGDASGSLIG